MPEQAESQSYCQQRLATYNITDEYNNTFVVKSRFKGREGTQNIYEDETISLQWFSPTKDNDIQILYKTLENRQLELRGEGRNVKPFYRICLNKQHRDFQKEVNKTDKKYHQDPGTGTNIFITQYCIDSFNAGSEVDTLYLIEGEFKAFSLWMNAKMNDVQLAVMGLPGIQMFTDGSKLATMFHEDIDAYVKKCQVKNIVLLHDADALQMGTWDPERDPNKDLSKRLSSFYHTVNSMREICKLYEGLELYYMHIKEEFMTEACLPADTTCKGMDDLLLARQDLSINVIRDLQRHTKAREYFTGFNASEYRPEKIQEYFLLKKRNKVPIDFYLKFESLIGDRVFNFQGWRYQSKFNEQAGHNVLVTVQHSESHKFIRVGTKFFKVIYQPNSKGIQERTLKEWNLQTLKMDYIDKGYKYFVDEIKKFSSFCNVPEHDPEKFQLEYKNEDNDLFYNLYYPITHELKQGEWPYIRKYFEHIFQDKFDFGLDYMYLSYVQPLQRLPIICLVSKEHNTGKSTFLWLIREIFMQNATIIGNQELHDNFNDDYVSKKFICIDEGLIEKVTVLEKIKSWNTSPKIKMNTKNVSRVEIDFFANIVLTSNHEENFIKIDPNADRFFVQKVPQLQHRDPDILDKMTAEIPHFLYYLKHEHKLVHQKKERFYFAAEDYSTDALRTVQRQSKSWLHKTIEIMMEEMFYELNTTQSNQKVLSLYLTESEIYKEVTTRYKKNVEVSYLRNVLKDEMRLTNSNHAPKGYKIHWDQDTAAGIIEYRKAKGRYYQFMISQYIKPDQLKDLDISENDIFLHTEMNQSETPF